MKHFAILTLAAALLFGCGNGNRETAPKNTVPDRYTYSVVRTYDHPRTSYTQGLQFVDGQMWESTGNYGRSHLQRIDLGSGKVEIVASLPKDEFGEGITLLGDRIYQLTWLNRKAHVYDRATGEQTDLFRYKGEGWGLTTDGHMLYMSDGTSAIRIIEPETFTQKGVIPVTCNGESLDYLNELEWIDGRIWANVYTLDQIVIINPENGIVEGIVDLGGILPASERDATTDVLNGIAYDKEARRIFVTGKNWSKLFEIEIHKL